MPHMLTRAALLALTLTPLWAAAAPPAPVEVILSTTLEVKIDVSYGKAEAGLLRGSVTEAIRDALARGPALSPAARSASIVVVIEDARPTHPTPRQLADDPSIDYLRSVAVGGAELTATVRAADGRVLATVSERHWPASLELGSPAADDWADARVAIRSLAAKVAEALRKSG